MRVRVLKICDDDAIETIAEFATKQEAMEFVIQNSQLLAAPHKVGVFSIINCKRSDAENKAYRKQYSHNKYRDSINTKALIRGGK